MDEPIFAVPATDASGAPLPPPPGASRRRDGLTPPPPRSRRADTSVFAPQPDSFGAPVSFNTPPQAAPQYDVQQYDAQQYGAYGQQPQKYNVLSIISLVGAIIGFNVIAVILGFIALSQIKKTGEQGKGLAIAGIVIGFVYLAFIILITIFVIIISIGAASSGDYYTN